jgi:hypothetical protein
MLEGFLQPTHLPVTSDRGDSGESFYLGCLCSVRPTIHFLAFEAKQTSGRPTHLEHRQVGYRQGQKLIFKEI